MIDVKKVGLFIAECRKSKNWTQKQLGEKLGVTDRAVSKWETGRSLPDICLIEDICKLFDLQVSELLAGRKIEEEDYKKEIKKYESRLDEGINLFAKYIHDFWD